MSSRLIRADNWFSQISAQMRARKTFSHFSSRRAPDIIRTINGHLEWLGLNDPYGCYCPVVEQVVKERIFRKVHRSRLIGVLCWPGNCFIGATSSSFHAWLRHVREVDAGNEFRSERPGLHILSTPSERVNIYRDHEIQKANLNDERNR